MPGDLSYVSLPHRTNLDSGPREVLNLETGETVLWTSIKRKRVVLCITKRGMSQSRCKTTGLLSVDSVHSLHRNESRLTTDVDGQ